jgi:hypothetical protein
MILRIHPHMEDSDDCDPCVENAIVEDMLTDAQITKVRRNVVARGSDMRMRQKFVRGPRNALRITIPLL